jgi:hypothetical protein
VTTPKVSVLLAVRDGERYLMQALGSVFAQTFTDFELLVVDDASVDATPQLLASIGDSRLRVLRNETNLGQVPSLNRGLREARGRYTARLDHDDWCRPDRLERQVAVLDANPVVAVVGSWATIVDADDQGVGVARESIRDFVDFVYLNLVAGVLLPHPSTAYRRDVVLELGGYDESLGPSEDKDLWRRLALARCEARVVEAELIRYRLHGGQLSRVRAEQQARHDEQSHLVFLGALAGDAPVDVERLRLLLMADPRFFSMRGAAGEALTDLGLLLAGAAERLRLSAEERARLDARVRARVIAAARRGWHGDLPSWWLKSPRLVRYGLHGGGPNAAASAAATALMWPLAPPARVAGRGARAAGRAMLASGALRRLEGPASRSPVARRLYSWLISRP